MDNANTITDMAKVCGGKTLVEDNKTYFSFLVLFLADAK